MVGLCLIFETYSTCSCPPYTYLKTVRATEFRGRKVGYALFMRCVEEAAGEAAGGLSGPCSIEHPGDKLLRAPGR